MKGWSSPRCPRRCELIWALFDMFTSYNLGIAFIAAAIGSVLVEFSPHLLVRVKFPKPPSAEFQAEAVPAASRAEHHGLLSFSGAANSQECMVSGCALRGFANPNLSASKFLSALLDCGRAPASGDSAGQTAGDAASLGGHQARPSQPVARIYAWLCVRNPLVRRNVSLDLQHHAAVRRRERGCGSGNSDSFLPVPRDLS